MFPYKSEISEIKLQPVFRKTRSLLFSDRAEWQQLFHISRQSYAVSDNDFCIMPEDHVVRPPGFGPGFSPWQGDVLDQARLRPLALDRYRCLQGLICGV